MRILIYGHNFTPELTGIGKYSGELAAWLAERGHTVHAITAPPHYPRWRVSEEYRGKGWHSELLDGVHVHRTPLWILPLASWGAKSRILLESSFVASSLRWWLPQLLGSQRFDLVISVCPPLQTAVLPYLYSRLRGVPWLIHVQDLQVDAAVRLGMLEESPLVRLLFRLEGLLLSRASKVSTISESMLRRVEEKGAKEPILFPNWADTEAIRPLAGDPVLRDAHGVGCGEVLVLYSGNMGEKQGLDLVLDAAGRLRQRREVRFSMVGAGAARERLETTARGSGLRNVRFFDLYPRERLPQLLAAGDIHVITQRQAAADLVMPSKLTNILSAGRASVVTAAPGTELHRVIRESGAGLVTPPDDAEAFTSAIEELAADPAKRLEMGRNARKYAERHLSKEAILTRFESTLFALAREGSS